MDISTNNNHSDFTKQYIIDYELNQIINVVKKHLSHTTFGELLLDQCEDKEKFKKTMSKSLNMFPEEILAKQSVACEARIAIDSYNSKKKRGIKAIKPIESLSNNDIETLWKKKRKLSTKE